MVGNLSLFKCGTQPGVEFNINLEGGVFAVGQRVREMRWGFIERAVKKSIFVGLFFFCNKWLGEEKKKSLKLVSRSLFRPLGISWKMNMFVMHRSWWSQKDGGQKSPEPAGSARSQPKSFHGAMSHQWIFTNWVWDASWLQSLTNSMRKWMLQNENIWLFPA